MLCYVTWARLSRTTLARVRLLTIVNATLQVRRRLPVGFASSCFWMANFSVTLRADEHYKDASNKVNLWMLYTVNCQRECYKSYIFRRNILPPYLNFLLVVLYCIALHCIVIALFVLYCTYSKVCRRVVREGWWVMRQKLIKTVVACTYVSQHLYSATLDFK